MYVSACACSPSTCPKSINRLPIAYQPSCLCVDNHVCIDACNREYPKENWKHEDYSITATHRILRRLNISGTECQCLCGPSCIAGARNSSFRISVRAEKVTVKSGWCKTAKVAEDPQICLDGDAGYACAWASEGVLPSESRNASRNTGSAATNCCGNAVGIKTHDV